MLRGVFIARGQAQEGKRVGGSQGKTSIRVGDFWNVASVGDGRGDGAVDLYLRDDLAGRNTDGGHRHPCDPASGILENEADGGSGVGPVFKVISVDDVVVRAGGQIMPEAVFVGRIDLDPADRKCG